VSGPPRYDVCIVGGGLIGLAVGRALVHSHSGLSILMLEKEDRVAAHQSGHNSGVIHSGLYYQPGSLKAELCVEGRNEMYALCEELGVPYRRTGKVVVATRESELDALDELQRRGEANGLTGMRRLAGADLAEFEPAAAGIAGLHVPQTGVVDFAVLADRVASTLAEAGVDLRTGHGLSSITHSVDGVVVRAGDREFAARVLVNCAGLHSDRVAALAGIQPPIRILPFRGEYYHLDAAVADRVRGLIYPVPDARFPFLGVHFTRTVDDFVEVGPNAVPALGREHYVGNRPHWPDVRQTLAYPGTLRLARRHLRFGAGELLRSRSKWLYARRARRLLPSLEASHLVASWAGVRAQAVDRNGNLVDDFVIERAGATVHVLNAPSPGATASLAIGRYIAGQLQPLLTR
jgi:L-2-hydroxyglutarate oxidase